MTNVIFALIAGAGVFALVIALTLPRKKILVPLRGQAEAQLGGIQARLDKARIEVSAVTYTRRSLTLGIPLGLGLWFLVGSVSLAPMGILAGFIFTWSALERERDLRIVKYNKGLASVADTITTSYGVRPSLSQALQSAVSFTNNDDIRSDFERVLMGYKQGNFAGALNEVANRRQSVVFDSIANALIRADEASGEVQEMLSRVASATRENVQAFEDAIIMQLNARQNVQWGTYGPWVIFSVFRGMTFLLAMSNGANDFFAGANSFFSTIAGNLVALFAALISIWAYQYCYKISQRGLLLGRVESTGESGVNDKSGSPATSGGVSPLRGQAPLSGVV